MTIKYMSPILNPDFPFGLECSTLSKTYRTIKPNVVLKRTFHQTIFVRLWMIADLNGGNFLTYGHPNVQYTNGLRVYDEYGYNEVIALAKSQSKLFNQNKYNKYKDNLQIYKEQHNVNSDDLIESDEECNNTKNKSKKKTKNKSKREIDDDDDDSDESVETPNTRAARKKREARKKAKKDKLKGLPPPPQAPRKKQWPSWTLITTVSMNRAAFWERMNISDEDWKDRIDPNLFHQNAGVYAYLIKHQESSDTSSYPLHDDLINTIATYLADFRDKILYKSQALLNPIYFTIDDNGNVPPFILSQPPFGEYKDPNNVEPHPCYFHNNSMLPQPPEVIGYGTHRDGLIFQKPCGVPIVIACGIHNVNKEWYDYLKSLIDSKDIVLYYGQCNYHPKYYDEMKSVLPACPDYETKYGTDTRFPTLKARDQHLKKVTASGKEYGEINLTAKVTAMSEKAILALAPYFNIPCIQKCYYYEKCYY